MLSIFLSLFLGSVLVSAGDTPSSQGSPAKTSESASLEAEPSGVATVVEVKGEAKAVSKSTGEERALKEGDALYLDETISTLAGSSLQLEIADESLFTLSENTSIRMDLFDLDEDNKDGHLTASIAKGIFRFVSGKVAKVKPENVNIEVPSGTIGIRGTIVLGEIEGEKCLVSLEAEEGDKAQHRIVFSGVVDGQKQEVEITKPGFAAMIEARGMAPKPAFELPQENRERFQQNLPAAKYLPRDGEGRPAMNPNVRDPKKYPGPMKRDEQKNLGGPNPPNGPGGSGKENFKTGPQGSDFVKRGGDEQREFDGNRPETQESLKGGEKSAYQKAGYQLPFDETQPPQRGNFQDGQNSAENLRPENEFNRGSENFGKFKPDFGSRGPRQNSDSFQARPRNEFEGLNRFQNGPDQNVPGGFNRPGPINAAPQGPNPSGGSQNQENRPPGPGGGKNSSGGPPPQKR